MLFAKVLCCFQIYLIHICSLDLMRQQSAMILHPVSPIVLSNASASGCSLGLSASTVEASSAKSSVDSMVEDQLVAMLRQEPCYRVKVIPCTAGDEITTSSSSRLPYEEWRRKISEWCYKVSEKRRSRCVPFPVTTVVYKNALDFT